MKKFLLLTLMLVAATTAYAQKSSKEINREYAQEYKKIGKDRSLTGYEKGQKKRELALKQKQENIKNKAQHNNHSTSNSQIKKDLDKKINELDKRYDKEKSAIEKNSKLAKNEKNVQKKALEKKYKNERDILKKEKDKY